ncbi:hypothetical protein [Duganella radicis]|uniref:Uncharacterized protein n=1 Tax=Duganella radicis TaxID=551988 RepID=A0A6L6PKF2_9BURK|nr:hypothetical protein [Duganella radicis]MTV39422.1 hypothetical protein [Duganella radicis]
MELITSELLQIYVGEERIDMTEWHSGYGPVVYLNAVERRAYEIHVHEGLLLNAAGDLLDTGNEFNLVPRSGI